MVDMIDIRPANLHSFALNVLIARHDASGENTGHAVIGTGRRKPQ
jgi:hypothetical protein